MRSLATIAVDDPVEQDAFLLGRAKRGDSKAFEGLYRAHSGRVYGLCLRLTGDRAGAEDCTQETFINAWKALSRFEARSSFRTWLHRIAVNVVMKKRKRLSASMEITMSPEDLGDGDIHFDTPIEVDEIEAALAALPDGARDAVVLYGIYGYSHEETAEMLGVAEGTCRAQLHRGRKLIRERLQVT